MKPRSGRHSFCCSRFRKVFRQSRGNTLAIFGLSSRNGKSSILSGGEKQRLALARALIKQPKILLADEPTASLDRENKERIMAILKDFTNEGGTVVMVTHDLELIDKKMKIIRLNNC